MENWARCGNVAGCGCMENMRTQSVTGLVESAEALFYGWFSSDTYKCLRNTQCAWLGTVYNYSYNELVQSSVSLVKNSLNKVK